MSAIHIERLDHLVLTVASVAATSAFYAEVLGMTVETFGGDRTALQFGDQKINLHEVGHTFDPKAEAPTPGSADLCFLVRMPLDDVLVHVLRLGVLVVDGPVERTGATGPLRSIYIRDPDGNLIELSNRAS